MSGYDVSGRHHANVRAALSPQAAMGCPTCASHKAELARLRAANERLRELVNAIDAAKRAETRHQLPTNYGVLLCHLAAARRAVDEAGDLKEPTSTPRLDAALADQAIESQTQGPDVPAPQTP